MRVLAEILSNDMISIIALVCFLCTIDFATASPLITIQKGNESTWEPTSRLVSNQGVLACEAPVLTAEAENTTTIGFRITARGSNSSFDDQTNGITTIWAAAFNNNIHYVRSDPFELGGGTGGHYVTLRSTQPVVLQHYIRRPGLKSSWQCSTITPPGGSETFTRSYPPHPDWKVMFDLEVPQLPEGSVVRGTIAWVQVDSTTSSA